MGNVYYQQTYNFVSSLVKSLPPLQDVASMAGLDLPEFLGKIKADENDAVAEEVETEVSEEQVSS